VQHVASEFVVHLGQPVEIVAAGDALRVTGGDREATVDAVLAALGRAPNVAGLGLDLLGLELDRHGLPPFDPHTMQVADLPIYIAGDVDADRVVMHEASDEGFIAAWNALHGPTRFRRRTPLAIAFTDPEIATVGLPYTSLPEGTVSASHDFSRQSRALAMRSAAGMLKVYAEPGSGRLLGAELMTPHGEHLAHLLALAIEHELSVAEVLMMPVYHPVLEEGLRSALRSLARKAYGEAPLEFRQLDGNAN
jgi:dihydrolipoamide dehydrogenase